MSPLPNGDTDIAEALKRATQVVDAANVPADLRATAFDRVLSQILDGEKATRAFSADAEAQPGADTDPFGPLVSKLGVSNELAAEVFNPQPDGMFSVHIPTAKLAKTKSAATKELALLVMAGRQAGGEEWTDSDDIIAVLKHYGKFDVANNSSIMKEGENYWQSSGSGKKRRFKLRKTGCEAAGDLVKTITGS